MAMRTQTALVAVPTSPTTDGPVSRALAALIRGEWKAYGICRQTDAELWFADTSHRIHVRAASICHDCPVRRPCLAWALVFDEDFGVWGGLSPAERSPLRRRLAAGESLADVTAEALSPEAAGGEVA